MSANKIRLAIPTFGKNAWTGSLTYQTNLLYALTNYANNIQIQEINAEGGISGVKKEDWLRRFSSQLMKLHNRLPQKIQERSYAYYKHLKRDKILQNNKVDVVFSEGYYNSIPGVATLAWIADFQHLHIPEMFPKEDVSTRNNSYRIFASLATLVVLSSQNALEDFAQFAPEYADKGRVMRFVAHVPEGIYDENSAVVLKKYDLPEKFVYLPNQFWRHKNHFGVVEALNILKRKNIKPFIVCTGNTADYRNPTYFDELNQKIDSYNLKPQIAILGLIPHRDIYQLIRQSAFVLNPSFFEGWSTTVEETKSIGKGIVLSDIDVHREQDPPQAEYFNPYDTADLAKKIGDRWKNCMPGPDLGMESQAKALLPKRMQAFADNFTAIAAEGLEIVRSQSSALKPNFKNSLSRK